MLNKSTEYKINSDTQKKYQTAVITKVTTAELVKATVMRCNVSVLYTMHYVSYIQQHIQFLYTHSST
jgi:hypothetical protein